MPLDHSADDPDDYAYVTPTRPSELTSLADEDLFRLLRKVAFANQWPFDAKVQFEATARLIAALKDFQAVFGSIGERDDLPDGRPRRAYGRAGVADGRTS